MNNLFFSLLIMMTSSNGNISALLDLCEGIHRFRRLIHLSDAELWCFLWSAPEQTVKQTLDTPMILDVIALIITPL